MTDYVAARVNMVEGQVRPNRVNDPAVIDAMLTIPREIFVPKAARGVAYVDEDLHVGGGRYLIEPMVLGRLLQEARIGREDIVLDVGCATGYSTALISRIADTVVAVESDHDLAETAAENLRQLGLDNAVVVEGPLPEGYPKQAPYHVIVVNGAVAERPERLLQQLADGGRLVAVVSPTGHMGQAMLFQRVGGVVSGRAIFDAASPILAGFEPKPRFTF